MCRKVLLSGSVWFGHDVILWGYHAFDYTPGEANLLWMPLLDEYSWVYCSFAVAGKPWLSHTS